MTATQTFADALREARNGAGLSMSELGRRIGLTASMISRLESGGRRPSRSTVRALAQVLGCDETQADRLLLAAGFAPVNSERPALVLEAVQLSAELSRLMADEEYPLVVARHLVIVLRESVRRAREAVA